MSVHPSDDPVEDNHQTMAGDNPLIECTGLERDVIPLEIEVRAVEHTDSGSQDTPLDGHPSESLEKEHGPDTSNKLPHRPPTPSRSAPEAKPFQRPFICHNSISTRGVRACCSHLTDCANSVGCSPSADIACCIVVGL